MCYRMRSVVIFLIAAARLPSAASSRQEHFAALVNGSGRLGGQAIVGEKRGSTREVPAWLPDAVQVSWDEYFKKHYPPAPEGSSESLKLRWAFEWFAKCNVNRPNHGIINAIRKTALIPVIVDAYKTFYSKVSKKKKKYKLSKKSFEFTDEEIKGMQLGILFESAGRLSEIGWDNSDKFASKLYFGFRDTSFAAYKKYAKGRLDEKVSKEVYKAMKRMYMSPLSSKSNAMKKMLEKAHDLELIRCFGRTKLCKKVVEVVEDIGMNAAIEVVKYAYDIIDITGDRVKFNPITEKRRDYVCKVFGALGRRPNRSLEVVYAVPSPEMPDPEAEQQAAPTKCFEEGNYEASDDDDEDDGEDDMPGGDSDDDDE